MIKACIFDFDGTLMNTLQDTANSINHVLKIHGFSEHPVDTYKDIMGGSCYDMMVKATPTTMNDEEELRQMENEVIFQYSKHFADNCYPFKDVRKMLLELRKKNIELCIITNKPLRLLIPLLNEYFADIEFKHIIGADCGYPPKPNPASCNRLRQTLDIRYDEAIFIGDSEVDIAIAKNARAFSIGCGWGFSGGARLIKAGADYVIHNPLDVLEVVNILNKKSLQQLMAEAKVLLKLIK